MALSQISFVCAFFLYLSDNIVWFANMGIIEKMIFRKLKWKRFKDFFALWKNVVDIMKYIFLGMKYYKKIHDILSQLDNPRV
jgi:hypothetical protein